MRFTIVSGPSFNFDKVVFDLKTANRHMDLETEKPFTILQNNSGEITIVQTSGQKFNMVGIYSITGSLIKVTNNPGYQTVFQTDELPSGIYIIRASGNSTRFSEKIVINKI